MGFCFTSDPYALHWSDSVVRFSRWEASRATHSGLALRALTL